MTSAMGLLTGHSALPQWGVASMTPPLLKLRAEKRCFRLSKIFKHIHQLRISTSGLRYFISKPCSAPPPPHMQSQLSYHLQHHTESSHRSLCYHPAGFRPPSLMQISATLVAQEAPLPLAVLKHPRFSNKLITACCTSICPSDPAPVGLTML